MRLMDASVGSMLAEDPSLERRAHFYQSRMIDRSAMHAEHWLEFSVSSKALVEENFSRTGNSFEVFTMKRFLQPKCA